MSEPDATPPRALAPGWRELLLALAAALLLAAWPFRSALLSSDRVLFAVDTATVGLPWSAALPADAPRTVENPDLADQGTVFYPFYRWVARSWLAGDPPTWCPLLYAGAPGFGNAQAGALDPQVLALVLLERLGGKPLFDHGLALLAWLRVAAALLGSYALARRLGLGRAGAALAGIAFGFGGFLTLWLNHPLGHVAPTLPWLLFLLEGIRGPRPGRSAAGAALVLWLAILGGHVETAFFVGAAGGAWALALLLERRRRGLLAFGALALGSLAGAPVLLPTYEYLQLSAARFVREQAAASAWHAPDLVSLGLLLLVLGLGAATARLLGDPRRAVRRSVALPAGLGLVLALSGLWLFLSARGLGVAASTALVPDRLGAPGSARPYSGAGYYVEVASAWVPFTVLALALAAALCVTGPLRRRRLVLALGGLAFLLSIELPGLTDVYRFVPVVGLGATVRLAVVGSLGLGLLAGEALERAPVRVRGLAVLALLPLVALSLRGEEPPPLAPDVATAPEADVLVGFVRLPAARVDGTDSAFECWTHPGDPIAGARLRVEPIDPEGHALAEGAVTLPLEVHDEPSDAARREAPAAVDAAPEGAHWLRTPYLLTSRLASGHWRATLEIPGVPGAKGFAADGWTRRAAVFTVVRDCVLDPATLLAILAAAVLVALFPLGPAGVPSLCVLALALMQGLDFGRGVNPILPEAMAFPPTRTEAILARELGPWRFQPDSGVLPPDTGLVRGLRGIEGYDALDPRSFNDYRSLFLPPEVNPLLAWNARAVDQDDPAYRLFGVKLVAMREPWSHPRFELVASPRGVRVPAGESPPPGAVEYAETWIYRDTDPLPRAFCVPRVVSLDELAAVYRPDHSAWDPLAVAAVDGTWRPAHPFGKATVSTPAFTNASVRMTAELDGDGLLILTDQDFPGWTVTVDGEPRPLLRADVIFRGVALGAGRHEVVFRYRPLSIRIGIALAAVALVGIVVLGALGPRLTRPAPRPRA